MAGLLSSLLTLGGRRLSPRGGPRRKIPWSQVLPKFGRGTAAKLSLVRHEAAGTGMHLHFTDAQLQGAGAYWRGNDHHREDNRIDPGEETRDFPLRLQGRRQDRARRRGCVDGPFARAKEVSEAYEPYL
jgi:hypothetical protein